MRVGGTALFLKELNWTRDRKGTDRTKELRSSIKLGMLFKVIWEDKRMWLESRMIPL